MMISNFNEAKAAFAELEKKLEQVIAEGPSPDWGSKVADVRNSIAALQKDVAACVAANAELGALRTTLGEAQNLVERMRHRSGAAQKTGASQ